MTAPADPTKKNSGDGGRGRLADTNGRLADTNRGVEGAGDGARAVAATELMSRQ